MGMSGKIRDRIATNLKKLVPIIQQQKSRDVSEADTVTLVKDLLSTVFGYDKYAELTSEHAIRGTYCDLAVRLNDKLVQLIEVKSVGTDLDDRHVKQAVDYASNQGVEWVLLTNAAVWRLYQVIFAKPIDKRLIAEVDITALETRKDDHLERAYLLSKEGFLKGEHVELRDRQDATSRYVLAALLTENDSIIGCIRRELRRVVDVLVSDEEIVKVLRDEVIKRDNLEGAESEAAVRRVCRNENKAMRRKTETPAPAGEEPAAETEPTPA